ncbi:MAG TPA: ABC transporter permease subunit [Solirubrobacteraceae bacterium]
MIHTPMGPAAPSPRPLPSPTASPSRPARQSTGHGQDSISSWPLMDRVGYLLCWAAGLLLCALAAGIVLVMFVKGISYLRPGLLLEHPSASQSQSGSGGFLDPIEGTLLLTAIGIALAAPIGVAVAVWLSEYRRPAALAQAVESGIEMIAGAPSVVLAFFGLLIFARPSLAFLSQTSAGGAVYGRSFFAAGAMMSLLALPLVVSATREGLAQIPAHMREASYALGKTRATTIRRVLLPSIRPSIASGTTLGMGRIIGDTAIVVILLGASLHLEGAGGTPGLSTLRGTGSTLTSYVFENSPAGEGNAPEKAYAAAFVLLMMVLALNMVVTRLSSGKPRWLAGLTGPMLWRWMPWRD